MRIALAAALCLFTYLPALAAPKVIASVVPVHGIVSAVMGDKGQPVLLLEGSMSEHRATFTAQQVADLGKADLVFIIGHGLEAKLAQLSGTEAVNGKRFVELSEAEDVKTLAIREGGAWESHDHAAHGEEHGDEAKKEDGHGHEEGHDHAADAKKGDDHDHEEGHDHAAEAGEKKGDGHDHAKAKGEADDHGHGAEEGVLSFDPHVWLDPENAKAMAHAAAIELGKADPANAAAYAANAQAFAASLDQLSAEIAAELEPLKAKPFVVFHDAYQYFEARFGLSGVGSISDVSAQAPSAKRLREVREKIAAAKAQCVFREPQYDGKVVATVIEGTGAKEGVLDPLGADLKPGPEAYQQLLRNLAASLKACLSA